MKLSWGLLTLLFALPAFAVDDSCMTPDQIEAVVEDFKVRAEPLINSFILPTEIVYKDIPLMAEDHVSGWVDISDKSKYKVGLGGKKCDGYLQEDELRFLLCHELGHLAGGAPYMVFIGHDENILSAEGQADFFATSSCLPGIFASDDNKKFLEKANAEPELNALCSEGDEQVRGTCMRVLSASLGFSRFVSLTPVPVPFGEGVTSSGPLPQLNGKDTRVVAKTLTRQYPSPQCRLQTMIAGYQCRAENALSNFSQDSATALSCGEVSESASRPTCWFKPE